MDVYLEQMIRQKRTAGQLSLTILYFFSAALISYILLFVKYITPLYPAIVVGLFWGALYLSRKFLIEYEYILTNDELDVDRITAKKNRKRMLTVSARKFEIMEPTSSEGFAKALKDEKIRVKLDASEGEDSKNRYYAIFINKKSERMMLIFNPKKEMAEAMKRVNMLNIKLENE